MQTMQNNIQIFLVLFLNTYASPRQNFSFIMKSPIIVACVEEGMCVIVIYNDLFGLLEGKCKKTSNGQDNFIVSAQSNCARYFS